MNEILLNVISVIVTSVVIPLITVLGTKLITWINNGIKNDKATKYLTDATVIVTNAVKTVFQTYVEQLKAAGNFGPESQKEALEKAKVIALGQLNADVKNYITTNFGSLDEWLTNQIESTIYKLKNN